MKKLFLLRHAKSDWSTGIGDHDRTINKRGKKAARAMGAYMAERQFDPDLVLCSSAKRAQETLKNVMKGADANWQVKVKDSLYLAEAAELIGIVAKKGGENESVMLVGHNPGFHFLAMLLAGRAPDDMRARLSQKYPTCTLAGLQFDMEDWQGLEPRGGELFELMSPKRLNF